MPASKPRIVIVGASGMGGVVADIVEKQQIYEVAGFLDQAKPRDSTVLGYPVLGVEADLARVRTEQAISGVVLAIGDNWSRYQAVCRLEPFCSGIAFVSAIHPSAHIARGAEIGPGAVLMAGTIVNVNARVGKHCLMTTHASVDHDAVLGDFSSMGPGSSTGGQVVVGECTAISQGAIIIHSRRVGDHVVVGAGAVVVEDLPSCVVAYGVPARVIRSRQTGEPYL